MTAVVAVLVRLETTRVFAENALDKGSASRLAHLGHTVAIVAAREHAVESALLSAAIEEAYTAQMSVTFECADIRDVCAELMQRRHVIVFALSVAFSAF